MKRYFRQLLIILAVSLLAVHNLVAVTCSITTPATGSTTKNDTPWIVISANSENANNINDCQIKISDTSGQYGDSFLVYSVKASSTPTSYPDFSLLGQATSGNIIHHVQSALPDDTYYMKVYVWYEANDWEHSRRAESAEISFTVNTSWTDSTISADVTAVKAVHFNEVRTAIENWRTLRGMGAGSYTNLPVTADTDSIYAVDMNDLRDSIDAVWTDINADIATGDSSPTWSDDPAVAGTTIIKKIHMDELRNQLKY